MRITGVMRVNYKYRGNLYLYESVILRKIEGRLFWDYSNKYQVNASERPHHFTRSFRNLGKPATKKEIQRVINNSCE